MRHNILGPSLLGGGLREDFDGLFPTKQTGEGRRGRKQEPVVRVNPEIVESDCDRMIQEMEAAYLSDLESNQRGRPAVSKLQILEKALLKLKNPIFANFFLDKGGLEQFHNFLKRLPDGSWPLSHVRASVLQALLKLPYNEHHLKYTKLGKTLTALQNSKGEYDENKKIILEIKDKWSRIVCGVRMEYANLESFEKENHTLMKKKRRKTTTQNFQGGNLDNLGSHDLFKSVKMGFNFTIRPYSNLTKRDPSQGHKTEEIDKYLTRIRKISKLN